MQHDPFGDHFLGLRLLDSSEELLTIPIHFHARCQEAVPKC